MAASTSAGSSAMRIVAPSRSKRRRAWVRCSRKLRLWPAEPLLVRAPLEPHDRRLGELAVGDPAAARALAGQQDRPRRAGVDAVERQRPGTGRQRVEGGADGAGHLALPARQGERLDPVARAQQARHPQPGAQAVAGARGRRRSPRRRRAPPPRAGGSSPGRRGATRRASSRGRRTAGGASGRAGPTPPGGGRARPGSGSPERWPRGRLLRPRCPPCGAPGAKATLVSPPCDQVNPGPAFGSRSDTIAPLCDPPPETPCGAGCLGGARSGPAAAPASGAPPRSRSPPSWRSPAPAVAAALDPVTPRRRRRGRAAADLRLGGRRRRRRATRSTWSSRRGRSRWPRPRRCEPQRDRDGRACPTTRGCAGSCGPCTGGRCTDTALPRAASSAWPPPPARRRSPARPRRSPGRPPPPSPGAAAGSRRAGRS